MADLTPPHLIHKKPLARSRALRRDSTEAEKRLWFILRDRKLDGWKFRRQVAIESFIVDFCCIEARVIVEIDGEQHADARKHYDDVRTRELRTLSDFGTAKCCRVPRRLRRRSVGCSGRIDLSASRTLRRTLT
jgi:very-short-patch-repair endonuclease